MLRPNRHTVQDAANGHGQSVRSKRLLQKHRAGTNAWIRLYPKPDWSLNLAVNNLFNNEYYQSQFLCGDTFVKPSELRTLSLAFSRSF